MPSSKFLYVLDFYWSSIQTSGSVLGTELELSSMLTKVKSVSFLYMAVTIRHSQTAPSH